MKTCPVCHTKSFADITTCYNCMHHFENAQDSEKPVETAALQESEPSLLKLYPQAEAFEQACEVPLRLGIRTGQEDVHATGNEARLEIVVSLQPASAEAQNSFFNGSFGRVDHSRETQGQVIELC